MLSALGIYAKPFLSVVSFYRSAACMYVLGRLLLQILLFSVMAWIFIFQRTTFRCTHI